MATAAHAAATFQRLRGRPPEHAEALAGGLRNAMFRVEDWVVRYYVHDASAWELEVELLGKLLGSVPVPELVHAEAGDPPLAIFRYVEGVPFHRLDADARRAAAFSIGQSLARVSMHPGVGPRRPWESSFAHALESELLHARLGERARAVERIAGTPMPGDARLVHGDFRKWNVLVRDGCCAAILDWEKAHCGSPLEDLGLLLRYERDARPRFAQELALGFEDGGGTLPSDWRRTSRIADLAAMCKSLAEPGLPVEIRDELVQAATGSLEDLGLL